MLHKFPGKKWQKFVQNFLPETLDKLPTLCYTIRAVEREVPARDTIKGDEVHRVKKVRKKQKSLSTLQFNCQGESEWAKRLKVYRQAY
jgi:hypothetical protein